MNKKHLITIFCITVGASSALAVDFWPHYAVVIQMALYTIMVFGPLFLGLWSERNPRAFWISISSVLAHVAYFFT